MTVEVSDDGVGFDPARVNGHRYGVTRAPAPRCDFGSCSPRRHRRRSAATWTRSGLASREGCAGRSCHEPDHPLRTGTAEAAGAPAQLRAAVDARRTDRRHPGRGGAAVAGRAVSWLRWPLVVVVVVVFTVAVLATASVPSEERLGIVHWSEAGAAWTLVLLALDTRLLTLVVLLATHYTLTFAHTAIDGAASISLSEAVTATVIVVGYQTSGHRRPYQTKDVAVHRRYPMWNPSSSPGW